MNSWWIETVEDENNIRIKYTKLKLKVRLYCVKNGSKKLNVRIKDININKLIKNE